MAALFFISILFIIILVIFMFLILKTTVKKINSQTKLYFVDKLQEYDYLIDKKLEKLNKINDEIKEQEKSQVSTDTNNSYNNYEFDYQIIDLLNKTKYQDKNIFELNKKIDEKFNLDYVKILKKFLSQVLDDGSYQFCLSLKEKFDSKMIYSLKIMDFNEQKRFMKEFLSDKEYIVYDTFLKLNTDNDIDNFIDYLNELTDLNNPNIFVYVGSKVENYDYLSKYIKTIYSKDIYKGIKIIYRNHIYDYSLNERNV